MTPLHLTYGAGTLNLDSRGGMRLLLPTDAEASETEEACIDRALEQPLATGPLVELARGKRSAIILIACRTRRTGSQVFIPRMLRTLNAAGIADANILVYAATGTHDNWRPQDAPLLAGADAAGRLRFSGHDCRSGLVEVGTTSRGNRIALSRAYLDADLKIATGRVTYHYFAGFTGGRKAILPGVAGFDSIVFNHRMATRYQPAVGLDERTGNGRLDGNPIHEDMLEAARLAPPDFTLSTVLNTRNRIVAAFGGDMRASHAAAVDLVRPGDAPTIDQPADWMYLSCGGAHCDVNAVQSLKAVVNNYGAVRGGGAIIFAAECREGMAPWLRELCSVREPGRLEQRIAAGELRHPHNALFLRQATAHARIIMVSQLNSEEVNGLGFHKAENLRAAADLARQLAGEPRTSVVVPFGNTTVVRVPSPEAAA